METLVELWMRSLMMPSIHAVAEELSSMDMDMEDGVAVL